jgi:hypothetical protein
MFFTPDLAYCLAAITPGERRLVDVEICGHASIIEQKTPEQSFFPHISGIYLAFYYQPDQLSSIARFLPVYYSTDCSGLFGCHYHHSTEWTPNSNTICHFRFYDKGITGSHSPISHYPLPLTRKKYLQAV